MTPGRSQNGDLGELVESRLVTVLASGERSNGQDTLRGQTVWLLTFAFTPRDQPTVPVRSGMTTVVWRTYSLVSAQTGAPLSSCTTFLPYGPAQP